MSVVVIGSTGLDRLLAVDSYPQRDSKVRTTQYTECCGGNAANLAVALARLGTSVRLLTTIGDDPAGQWLSTYLQQETSSSSSDGCILDLTWLQQRPQTTTGITHIVVDPASRTCLHTPGTCGEYDASAITLNDAMFWENVVHLHSDTRHASAALALVRMAKKQRGAKITVSVDVEKDRKLAHFDTLVSLADIVFTNGGASSYWQQFHDPRVVSAMGDAQRCVLSPSLRNVPAEGRDQLHQILSSTSQPIHCKGSQFRTIVYTHGERGASLVHRRGAGGDDNAAEDYNYFDAAGILRDIAAVDTTGAGDALIGGFLHALYYSFEQSQSDVDGTALAHAVDPLKFGCWVAGCKVTQEGPQAGLPTKQQVIEQLGADASAIQAALSAKLTQFHVQ